VLTPFLFPLSSDLIDGQTELYILYEKRMTSCVHL
jgi:hypothetical protein